VKFLLLRKLITKVLRLRMLKEITRASKKNEKPIIKSVGLDLALIIGVDSNSLLYRGITQVSFIA